VAALEHVERGTSVDWSADVFPQLLAAGALAYSTLRLVEASGLWRQRAWAEWLGALSGGVYLPFEVYEIFKRVTAVRVSLFALNVVMVAYLARLLWLRRSEQLRDSAGEQTPKG